jgi:carboxylate-amine ligase
VSKSSRESSQVLTRATRLLNGASYVEPMSELDDSRLRVAFDNAALSLTVGAEEEYMLVDPQAGRLLPVAEDVLGTLQGDLRFQTEFRAAQLEIATRPYLSTADVGRELAIARIELAEAIIGRARIVACGAHPNASDVGPITDGERYRAIAATNPWAALHKLTCGLHVHVALADAERALAVYNALRSYLPEFVALAANSPYHRFVDSGTASMRYQLNRCMARHGVPPAFRDWNAYAEFVEWGRKGGSIPDTSYHWWDLRLHPGYGTLEIRACDSQTELADTVALVGLAQTLISWLAGRHDAGHRLPVDDSRRIAESLWLGARTGGGGMLLDLETGAQEAIADRIARLVEHLAPAAVELGTERELSRVLVLARAGGADRQRDAVEERGAGGLVDWLAAETVVSAHTYLVRTALEATSSAAGGADSVVSAPALDPDPKLVMREGSFGDR